MALRLVPAVTDYAVCAFCGALPGAFRDAVSEREFRITGLCQPCQDEVFAEPEHGPDDEVCPHCGSVVCYVADSRDGFVLRCGNTGKAVEPHSDETPAHRPAGKPLGGEVGMEGA
mgnify:CR=1 FL=1